MPKCQYVQVQVKPIVFQIYTICKAIHLTLSCSKYGNLALKTDIIAFGTDYDINRIGFKPQIHK